MVLYCCNLNAMETSPSDSVQTHRISNSTNRLSPLATKPKDVTPKSTPSNKENSKHTQTISCTTTPAGRDSVSSKSDALGFNEETLARLRNELTFEA